MRYEIALFYRKCFLRIVSETKKEQSQTGELKHRVWLILDDHRTRNRSKFGWRRRRRAKA